MAKAKPISKTVHIGKANLIRLANKVIDKVFENTVFRGKDVRDKQFKPYSEGYKKEVQGGGGKVDLFKSGKMMRSLLIRRGEATDDTIPVGVINPKSTQKLVTSKRILPVVPNTFASILHFLFWWRCSFFINFSCFSFVGL